MEFLAVFDSISMMNEDCFEARDTEEEIRLFFDDIKTLWIKAVCWYNPHTIAEFKVPRNRDTRERMTVSMYHATRNDTASDGTYQLSICTWDKEAEEETEVYMKILENSTLDPLTNLHNIVMKLA